MAMKNIISFCVVVVSSLMFGTADCFASRRVHVAYDPTIAGNNDEVGFWVVMTLVFLWAFFKIFSIILEWKGRKK